MRKNLIWVLEGVSCVWMYIVVEVFFFFWFVWVFEVWLMNLLSCWICKIIMSFIKLGDGINLRWDFWNLVIKICDNIGRLCVVLENVICYRVKIL